MNCTIATACIRAIDYAMLLYNSRNTAICVSFNAAHPCHSERMENLTANYTNYSDASQLLHVPAFIAFNVVMLVGCILPVTVLDISILVAFAVDKVTPGKIRFILANFLLIGVVMSFILTVEHLTALVLATTDYPLPPLEFCSTILWALFGAGALRLTLTAYFSIVVFILIVKGITAINKTALVVSMVILWIVCFFSFNVPLLALPRNNDYVADVACLPVGSNTDDAFVAIYLIVFGATPLFFSIVMPIMTAVYLFKHKTTKSSSTFLKAMAKLSSLLILGGMVNFIGEVLPAVITQVAFSLPDRTILGGNVFYVTLAFFDLSLWPTPILMLVFVKSIGRKIQKILYCIICRGRHLYQQSVTVAVNLTE